MIRVKFNGRSEESADGTVTKARCCGIKFHALSAVYSHVLKATRVVQKASNDTNIAGTEVTKLELRNTSDLTARFNTWLVHFVHACYSIKLVDEFHASLKAT